MTNDLQTNKDEFNKLYELAIKEGDKRFGSSCKHEKIINGVCCNCLRRVIK